MRKFVVFLSPLVLLFAVRSVSAASLTLTPATSSSTSVTIDVMLNTENKQTSGVDVVATFDKDKLTLVSVQPGVLYDTYTPAVIDNKSGKVSISGLVKPEESYSGQGKFAQLVFQPVGKGDAEVEILYTKGERNDSNVADMTGNDILTSVNNTTVKVMAKGKGGIAGFFQSILDFLIFWD